MKHIFSVSAFALIGVSAFAQTSEDTLTIIGRAIGEIEVVARVEQPTTNHATMEKEGLNAQNTGQNLPYLLSATPSFISVSEDGLGIGYTHFSIRGTNESRINMTVNDVPLNDAESSTVFWVNMTDFAGSVGQLNVQRGVGTSTNGASAFGASINMNTLSSSKKAEVPTKVELGFNGGMYNTFREMVNADVRLPHHMRACVRLSKVNSDGYRDRASSDLFSYHGALGYYGKKTSVSLTTFGGMEKVYVAWHGISKEQLKWNRTYNPDGVYYDTLGHEQHYKHNFDHYLQQHYQLNWAQRYTPNWSTSITAHYTYGNGFTEEIKANKKYKKYGMADVALATGIDKTDILRQKHLRNHSFGGVVSATYRSEPADLMFGGAASHYIGDHFGYAQDYRYHMADDVKYYDNRGCKTDANIYAKANWRVIHQAQRTLTLYGDLQYRFVHYTIDGTNDDDDYQAQMTLDESFHFFNPKAGITYEDHGHQVYFNFAIANREPARKNYTESGLQDKPKAERLYDYELGYTYSHRRFAIGANLYFMDYRDQLVTSGVLSSTGSMLTLNVDKSYRMGIELTANVEIQKWLHWQGTMTLSRNIIRNFTDSVYDTNWNAVRHSFGNRQIAFSPGITAVSSLTFRYAGLTADIRTQVVGHQYIDNTQSKDAKLPAYTTTDINLAYQLPVPAKWPSIQIKAQVNNLLNSRYVSTAYVEESTLQADGRMKHDIRYFPQAGINVHAGFVVQW